MCPAAAISCASLVEQIRCDIANRDIKLPMLPEIALKVRDAIESDRAGAATVAQVIARDAALSARLLQVANSPLYPGNHRIDSLVHAVARLGLKLVRTLVTSLVLKQVFQSRSPTLSRQLRIEWDTSVQVAAICRALADDIPELDSDQAMLGGLVHNIGALPVLSWINDRCAAPVRESLVAQLIDEAGPAIGDLILTAWHFADTLACIPTACRDLGYNPGPAPTYVDVVLVARLRHLLLTGSRGTQTDWSKVPAFGKVGIETEVIVMSTEEPAGKIAEVRSMLEG